MYRSDASGRFLFVNPALVAMLGYDSIDEVLALDVTRDVYFESNGRGPVLEEYRERGVVDGLRVAWKTRAGTKLSVLIFGHVVAGGDGLTFDATVIDITDIDAVERELRDDRAALAR